MLLEEYHESSSDYISWFIVWTRILHYNVVIVADSIKQQVDGIQVQEEWPSAPHRVSIGGPRGSRQD